MDTIINYLGSSRDQRTNRWHVECPACGHVFEPQTTRLSTQALECPKAKCRVEMVAKYNDEPPTCTLLEL